MTFLSSVWHWLTTDANWTGPSGILDRSLAQIEISVVVIAVAVTLGVTAGYLLARGKHGGFLAVNAANAARAVPSLALLTLLVTWPLIAFKGGGFDAAFITLVALAIPPILTNAYVAMREVDREVLEAATASGMSSRQRLLRVEIPLALPLTVAGVRTASIEVVATSTLAGYVSYNCLGVFIFAGLNSNDTVEAFCGALAVATLAGLVDLVLATAYRFVTPDPRKRTRIGFTTRRGRLALQST
jgi:osmoprotectant transport system permease protein